MDTTVMKGAETKHSNNSIDHKYNSTFNSTGHNSFAAKDFQCNL